MLEAPSVIGLVIGFCVVIMKRKILVILSNRFLPSATVRYLELDCESDGSIVEERRLRGKPRKPIYDEVWQNDEGKKSLESCTRIRRHYGHALEKPA
jgi:hypothetical protein